MPNLSLRKLSILFACLTTLIFSTHSHAAFPDDFESGVVLIEEGLTPGLTGFLNSFSQTATLDASISGGSVIMNYNKKDSWPRGSGSVGTTNLNCCVANAWAFIKVGDTWYGGTWEFLRNGQTTKLLSALRGPSHLRFSPLQNYSARNGDIIGLMVAGITRNSLSFNNIRERSNIVFYQVGGGVVDPADLGFGPAPVPSSVPPLGPILELLED